MIFSLLLACEPGRDTSSTDEPVDTGPFDADGDGVFTPDDCLDDNADAYPGAEDPPGDDVDADCDGLDGLPFEGCSPVEVPDLYATVDDAVLAGDVNICLGAGEFTPAGIGEVERLAGIKGQGRGVTTVHSPAAFYEVGVLSGITVTVEATRGGAVNWYDVTADEAVIDNFSSFSCTNCALVNSPIALSVDGAIAGVILSDSWVTGSSVGISTVTTGCAEPSDCQGIYLDVRVYNSTFTGNGVVFDFDLSGEYSVFLVAENSIFAQNSEAIVTAEIHRGSTTPGLYPDGGHNTAWDNGQDFPDGYDFKVNEEDPGLDYAFGPPRPLADGEVGGAAGNDATLVDFWGRTRDDEPDRGAVER